MRYKQAAIDRSLMVSKITTPGKVSSSLSAVDHWQQLYGANARSIRLGRELVDYNRFWSRALSAFMSIYVLLVSFIIYIIFVARTAAYLSFVFAVVLMGHIAIMFAIVMYCGELPFGNARLAATFHRAVIRRRRVAVGFHHYHQLFSVRQRLKLALATEALWHSPQSFGFTLVNGYLITHSTGRDIVCNILIYLVLVLH